MAKIIKGVIVVMILYLAFTKGLPWLKSEIDSLMSGTPTGASNQEICHKAAERAADAFAKRLRRFSSPPIDTDEWDKTVSASRLDIESAEKQCRNCDHEACLEVTGVLGELERLVISFDENVQAGRGIPLNGASRLDRVHDGLNRARSRL